MAWLSALIAAIVAEVLGRFGGKIGKTEATDAKQDTNRLDRAGSRIREWLRSRNAGK
jgi:hypothetical protein